MLFKSGTNATNLDSILRLTSKQALIGHADSINTTNLASLDVSGNMKVGSTTNSVFEVDNNIVLINGGADSTSLFTDAQSNGVSLLVNGTIAADSILINDKVEFDAISVQSNLLVDQLVTKNPTDTSAIDLDLTIASDINSADIYGMKFEMASALTNSADGDADEDSYYLLANNSTAYGLYVDMTNLRVANAFTNTSTLYGYGATEYGNKFTAAFLGGPIGIGTASPSYPLHVTGEQFSTFAGLGTNLSTLVFRDYGYGKIGLNIVNESSPTTEHIGLMFAPGVSTDSQGAGRVGIGTTDTSFENDTAALVVNGDVRVGAISTALTAPEDSDVCNGYSCKYGSKLFFSGGPRLSGSINSDNGDDLFLARYNSSAYESELRLNFSSVSTYDDATGEDSFSVGYSDGAVFQEVFSVNNDHTVCIYGKTDGLACSPAAPFHVIGERDKISEDTSSADDYGFVSIIENASGGSNASILGLKFSGLTTAELTDDSNFINFSTSEGVVGTIEGNNFGGIRFKTTGADYAEFLPKLNAADQFSVGDIVGVYNGQITKDTSYADQLMVISSSAAVAGNWPGKNDDGYELVAFFGQVKTKVVGKVTKGDYIVSSGLNNGTGIAVSSKDLSVELRKNVVGRAWEGSDKKKEKLINTAVGFSFGAYNLTQDLDLIHSIQDDVEQLKQEREDIINKYDDQFNKQSEEIEMLLKQLEQTISLND